MNGETLTIRHGDRWAELLGGPGDPDADRWGTAPGAPGGASADEAAWRQAWHAVELCRRVAELAARR
jgi:hypothetical protein